MEKINTEEELICNEGRGYRENLWALHRGNNVSDIHGTGLGFIIVKRAANLLKASIEVKSQLNAGTTIIIKLPLKNLRNPFTSQ